MPIIGANITSITTDSGTPSDFITNDRSLTIGGEANVTLVGSTLGIWIQGGAFATPTLVGTVDMSFLLGLAVPWSFDLTTSAEVDAQSLADGTYTIFVADTLAPLLGFDTQTVTVDATSPTAIATVTALSADTGLVGDFVTNAAAQTVSGTFAGTLAAGEKIQVSTDGATWVDATAGAGTWTASVTLPSGGGILSVRTIDVAANVAAGVGQSFTLDTTAPAAPAVNAIGGADSTVSTQPGDAMISGTAEAGSGVTVKSGATTLGTATADGSGNWSLVLSESNLATIGQGSGKTVTATASDLAGNISTTTTSLAFTVDTAAPAAFATVTGLSADTGTAGDFVTNAAAQTVSGTFTGALAAGEKIQVSTNETTWIDAAAGSGTWTASVTLPAGSGTLSVQTIDAAGNVTAGTGHGFTLDAVAPVAVATVTALSSDTGASGDFITSVASQTVSGTFTGALGAGETIQVSVDGATWIDASTGAGTWSAAGVTLPAGSGTLSVRTIDVAANVTAGTGHAFTLDASAPAAAATVTALSADSGTAGDFVTNVAAQTVSGTFTGALGAGETIQVSVDGATWIDATVGAGTWSAAVTLPSGIGTLSVRTIDTAANVTAGTGRVFTLDTSAPAAPTVNPIGGADGIVSGQAGDATVGGTAEAGSTITVKTGATVLGAATADGGGKWSLDLTPANIAAIGQGMGKTVTATASDKAGNASSAAASAGFTVDTVAPTATGAVKGLSTDSGTAGDFITNVGTQTVSGTFAGTLGAGEKIQVSADGTTWVDAAAGAGTWSASDVTLSPGVGLLLVQTIDTAGNTTLGTGQTYILDTAAPGAVATVTALSADTGTPGDFVTTVASQTVSGTFTGTLGAGDKIEVSVDGATWIGATAGAGTWSAAGVTLSPGSGTLSVRTIDAAANVTSGVSHSFTLTVIGPTAVATVTALSADSGVAGDFITNVAAQTVSGTFTGTLAAGDKIQVSVDGATWIDATAGAGTWSAAGVTLLAGNGTLSVRTIDVASNATAGVGHAYTLDATAPAAPAIGSVGGADGTVSGQPGDANVTGTAEAGSTITVKNGATTLGTTTTDGSGAWTYTLTPGDLATIGQGSGKTVSATATDTAGNSSTSTNSAAFTIDTVVPPAVATATALSADSGTPGDFITAIAAQTVSGTFTGTLGAGDKIQVSANGTTWVDATAGAGTWSAAGVTLSPGTGTLSVRTIDAATNTTAGVGHAYTLDTGAPPAIATVTALSADTGTPGDFVTNVASQTVSGTFTGTLGAGEKIQVSVDGTTWIDAVAGAGTWSAAGVILLAGSGTLSVRTIDASSNATAGVGHAYTLDALAPAAPAIGSVGGADGTVSSQPGDATVTGTAEAGSTITVKNGATTLGTTTTDGGGAWTYTLTPTDLTTIGQGSGKTVSATATDTAGNSSASSSSAAFTIDTVVPPAIATVTAISSDTGTPGDFVTSVAAQTVSGTFIGALGAGEKIQVSANGTNWIDATSGVGTWSATGVTLSPGSGTLSVRTIDTASNSTAGVGHAYTLDTVLPPAVATVTALSADTGTPGDFVTAVASQTVSGTFTGTLGAGEKIQVSLNGTTWIDATAGAGTWSAAGVTLSPGSGTLSVRTIDAAANVTAGNGHGYTLTVGGPAAVATVTALSADTGTAGDFITSIAAQTVSGTFTGTLAAGDKIQVSTNGTTWIDATAGAGTWSAAGITLSPGSGTLSVRTIDVASGVTDGVGHAFTLDSSAPAAPVIGTVGGPDGTVSGQPGDATVTGTAEAGSTITVTNGATTLGTTTTDGSGNWTYTLTPTDQSTIGQGTGKTVSATATDAAGNSSTSTTSPAFAIDTVAPPAAGTVTGISADTGTPGDFVTNVASQTVSGSFSGTLGAGEKFQVSANGTTWVDATAGTGTWSAAGVVLSPGTGVLMVRTIDAASNTTLGTGHAYTLDTVLPPAVATVTALSADTGTPGDFVTTVASQTVSGTFTGTLGVGEKIQVSANGTTWIDASAGAGTWTASGVILSPGAGTLSVRTIDAATNVTAGVGHSYTLDISGGRPLVSIGPTTISHAEGDSGIIPYIFTVTLDHAATSTETINWSVSGGNASGSDFAGGALPSGTLTFAAGETSKSVIVNVQGDTLVETNESFLVNLSSPSSGLVIGTATVSGTIVNDDGTTGPQGVHNDAYIVLQNKTLTIGASSGVLFNDEGTAPQSAVHRTGPENGTLDFHSDGSFKYTAVNGFAGIDSFTYEASTNGSLEATTALVYVVPTITNGASTTLNLTALDREEQVAATYISFFGRGADAPGFEFWVNQFAINETKMSQHDLFANIASSFAISDEAKALYPFLDHWQNATDTEIHGFLNSVYDNMFNRTPDAGGLAYWTTAIKQTLASGAFVGFVLIQIINGAQETAAGHDISTLMGKVAVNLEYVQQQEQLGSQWTSADDGAEARALMHAVTDNPQTVLTGVVQAQHLVQADV